MTNKFHYTAALIGAAALTACAGPQNPSSTMGVLDNADRNADGAVDQMEWVTAADETFTELDANHDGDVTVEELQDGFEVFDVDGDGVLATWEFQSAQMDANADGVITAEEWSAAPVHKQMDLSGDGQVTRSELRTYGTRGQRSFDRDGDGLVSATEVADADQFTLWRF